MEELILDVSCSIAMELIFPYFQTLFELEDFKFRITGAENVICYISSKEPKIVTTTKELNTKLNTIETNVKTFNY